MKSIILSCLVIFLISFIVVSEYNSDESYIPSSSSYTKAVDVGNCEMQDVVFILEDGEIVEEIPIGEKFPQSERFKNKYKNNSCDE